MNINLKLVPGDYTNEDAIHNLLSYIFDLGHTPLPIRFYGLLQIQHLPPAPNEIIAAFEDVHRTAAHTLSRQLWHLIITFPIVFDKPYGHYFYFADAVARLFTPEYPVCYAYHEDNKTTRHHHSHFHYAISTSSIIPRTAPLDADKLKDYLQKIPLLAQTFHINTVFIN